MFINHQKETNQTLKQKILYVSIVIENLLPQEGCKLGYFFFEALNSPKTSFHGTKQTCLRLQLSEENKGLFSEIYACFYVAILSSNDVCG